jgi:importin-7
MIAAILRIIAADTIDPYASFNASFISAYQRKHSATRQACAVWLKNRVHSSYSLEVPRRADQTVIAESEREALRINILPLLAASPSRSISLQLANTLRTVVAHDFPASRWRSLVSEIKTLLTSSNVSELHAGCLAALEAVRAFRYGLYGK